MLGSTTPAIGSFDPDLVGKEPATILVVDDVPGDLRLMVEALKDRYRVKVATSGTRALELAAGPDQPDLILLDVVMPELDGYEVCRRLKEEPATRSIPVIFISVQDDIHDEAFGLGLGAIDYIIKPIRPPIVRARVRNHVALKRSLDLLARMTTIDHLTGIHNRRGFDEYLNVEWHRAVRTGEQISLIAIDIDHFKAYNDHYGHPSGDRCLAAVASALRSSATRLTDLVARCGGEEFGCILPATDPDGALSIAEDMLRKVADLAIAHERSPVGGQISISLGVTSVLPQPDSSVARLVETADRALYEAKMAGRNRVIVRQFD
ncbi:MAG: diguanylate cyclase [Rhodocyclaceae bacterium]|jgi:diguanylate cyclase (GGDEF)-like protein|nr:diguanylate cyclase [Rhodocyclaceae bacterium]